MEELVREAREIREDEVTIHQIDGYCHENAVFLAKFLNSRGINSYIRWGATSNKNIETVKEAEQKGIIHFWVETEDFDVLDIFSMESSISERGDVLCERNYPSTYQAPNNSLINYKQMLNKGLGSNNLLSYQKYQELLDIGIIE